MDFRLETYIYIYINELDDGMVILNKINNTSIIYNMVFHTTIVSKLWLKSVCVLHDYCLSFHDFEMVGYDFMNICYTLIHSMGNVFTSKSVSNSGLEECDFAGNVIMWNM